MRDVINLGEFNAEVARKKIKNVHLSVYPPNGKVRITAPLHMELDTIRVFAISKLAWIKGQQRKMQAQERETPREFLDRESHYLWGERYLLQVVEKDVPPAIDIKHRKLVMQVRPGMDDLRRLELLDSWYREQIRQALPELLARWESAMQVKAAKIFIQRMKTRWGSCNPSRGNIRLNTDLAKKPPECLEYILAHELAHLIEPTHNSRFIALMDHFMPMWRHIKEELNRLPVRHEEWGY